MDQKHNTDNIDRWLDSAFGQMGDIEPLAGLESRIRQRLQAKRESITPVGRWRMCTIPAFALGVALIAIVWVGIQKREGTTISPVQTTELRNSAATHLDKRPPEVSQRTKVVSRRHQPVFPVAVAKAPKLEQFPASRELSEQQKRLWQFLQQGENAQALLKSTAPAKNEDLNISRLQTKPLTIADLGEPTNRSE